MKKRLIILSPHLDDAVLSLGSHIERWKETHSVTVLSLFTSMHDPVSPPAYSQAILDRYHISDTATYSRIRLQEEHAALQVLGVSGAQLGLIDGGFRSTAGIITYPTAQELFSGNIAPSDHTILRTLHLLWHTTFVPGDIILVPAGIGRHADHLITRLSVKNLGTRINIWQYLDFPYAMQSSTLLWNYSFKKLFSTHSSAALTRKKLAALACYKTQMPLLFPSGIPAFTERVFPWS